jgi:hypothetical protein
MVGSRKNMRKWENMRFVRLVEKSFSWSTAGVTFSLRLSPDLLVSVYNYGTFGLNFSDV